jgi:hypothetical protein
MEHRVRSFDLTLRAFGGDPMTPSQRQSFCNVSVFVRGSRARKQNPDIDFSGLALAPTLAANRTEGRLDSRVPHESTVPTRGRIRWESSEFPDCPTAIREGR